MIRYLSNWRIKLKNMSKTKIPSYFPNTLLLALSSKSTSIVFAKVENELGSISRCKLCTLKKNISFPTIDSGCIF